MSYLIMKRGLYYRPNNAGYTGIKDEAGRYSYLDAVSITFPNGSDGPRDGMDFIKESEAPEYSPACWEDTKNYHREQYIFKLLEKSEEIRRLVEQQNEIIEKIKSTFEVK